LAIEAVNPTITHIKLADGDLDGVVEYVPDFITLTEHDELLEQIDRQIWLTELKRRVQHYGYKYLYKSRKVDASMYLGQLPTWADIIARRLQIEGYIDVLPDQAIVNEYLPGQGIAKHIDCPSCFIDTIVSLSLGSACA
jgi:alkylated DNA repair dioxygenase AlkB